jgi:hypothetical protein
LPLDLFFILIFKFRKKVLRDCASANYSIPSSISTKIRLNHPNGNFISTILLFYKTERDSGVPGFWGSGVDLVFVVLFFGY